MIANNNQHIIDCAIGEHTKVWDFVNLYGCTIGNDCMIGSFVEIQKNVKIGNKVRVQSHSFVCEGVTIEDDVFIGHHVVFINDNYPHATSKKGDPITPDDWKLLPIVIEKGASIGSGAVLLGGITIGSHALVGAGSVVTKNVPSGATVAGNPARVIGKVRS